MQKTYAGQEVEVNEEGYLVDPEKWNKEIGAEIANELSIELADKHWEVLNWLREQHQQGIALTIRKVGKSGVVDIKEFYSLFPGGPLKISTRIAGLQRPESCV